MVSGEQTCHWPRTSSCGSLAHGGGARNVKKPDVGVVGCVDFGFAVGRFVNGHFHVGLAGAEPDLAHEDVGEANGLIASLNGRSRDRLTHSSSFFQAPDLRRGKGGLKTLPLKANS